MSKIAPHQHLPLERLADGSPALRPAELDAAAGCDLCLERLAATATRFVAGRDARSAPTAAPGLLLLRARLRARREAEERGVRPLEVWNLVAAAVCLVALAAGVRGLVASLADQAAAAGSPPAAWLGAALLVAAIPSTALLLASRRG